MGRKPKNWIPTITERNQWLADDFMNYVGTIYDEYFNNFVEILQFEPDIVQDSLMRTYNAILYNGIDNPVYVDENTPVEEREKIYRNKWFIACKNNGSVGITSDRYRTRRSDNDITHILKDEEYTTADDKVRNDMWNDFRTLYLLEHVCKNFSVQTCYCFRIYYMVPDMTYKKLQQLTKLKDARTRVTTVNRYLRENKERLQKDMEKAFTTQYPQFER